VLIKCMSPEKGFLGLSSEQAVTYDTAHTAVIPFGLETSVTYGRGTAKGPQAIIDASHALELFDEDLMYETYRHIGLVTLETPSIDNDMITALNQLTRLVKQVVSDHKFPLVLGGEHSITPAIVQALVERFGVLKILHVDAHADLRESYQQNTHSHASAMRRCLDLDGVEIISCGIRSISQSEVSFLEKCPGRVKIYWAKNKREWSLNEIASHFVGIPGYISIDVDGFDPSIMPATGTPEPNGLLFEEVIQMIKLITQTTSILGADINELAPIPNFHSCDFLAAKLAYKLLGLVFN
jgi:agmatinase